MNTAIVLSGGKGMRFCSNIAKQYIKVNGKMMIMYCLETLLQDKNIDHIRIVADFAWKDEIKKEIENNCSASEKAQGITFSKPGITRQLSIYNAMNDIKTEGRDDLVIIHDAVRPLVSHEIIERVVGAAQGHDGAMPILPMKDTVYLSENGASLSRCLPREKIFAGQAPEVFRYDKYLSACERLMPNKIKEIHGSTEPALMAGMDIVIVPGDEKNFKITTQSDLERFVHIINN